ncbi:hypothetical protein RGQ13_05595 [Thalassotalea psychrophila]|uniref:DUF2569 domain-containing protein n=1 Tax=Thalassotalea psychrophila TaxID=3065647 RepID=A0ABY9TXC4_9GAMM|nr:hypothetical protein RGQ13_05595 [Colwelliaceae bacterium SQ149]
MIIVKGILFFTAILIMLYPFWGIVEPASYLNELIETFPFAKGANDEQVLKSSLILLIPNSAIAIALIFLTKFISKPGSYGFAKVAAISLISFPILQSLADIFIASVLSQHVQDASVSIELSSQKLFYFLFGLAIWGIGKSQSEHNKTIK